MSFVRVECCVCKCLESFGMGKIHKEIAMQMVQAAGDDATTEQSLIKVRRMLCVREIVIVALDYAEGFTCSFYTVAYGDLKRFRSHGKHDLLNSAAIRKHRINYNSYMYQDNSYVQVEMIMSLNRLGICFYSNHQSFLKN